MLPGRQWRVTVTSACQPCSGTCIASAHLAGVQTQEWKTRQSCPLQSFVEVDLPKTRQWTEVSSC
eukprot:2692342-Amphidinium_carterae.1